MTSRSFRCSLRSLADSLWDFRRPEHTHMSIGEGDERTRKRPRSASGNGDRVICHFGPFCPSAFFPLFPLVFSSSIVSRNFLFCLFFWRAYPKWKLTRKVCFSVASREEGARGKGEDRKVEREAGKGTAKFFFNKSSPIIPNVLPVFWPHKGLD